MNSVTTNHVDMEGRRTSKSKSRRNQRVVSGHWSDGVRKLEPPNSLLQNSVLVAANLDLIAIGRENTRRCLSAAPQRDQDRREWRSDFFILRYGGNGSHDDQET